MLQHCAAAAVAGEAGTAARSYNAPSIEQRLMRPAVPKPTQQCLITQRLQLQCITSWRPPQTLGVVVAGARTGEACGSGLLVCTAQHHGKQQGDGAEGSAQGGTHIYMCTAAITIGTAAMSDCIQSGHRHGGEHMSGSILLAYTTTQLPRGPIGCMLQQSSCCLLFDGAACCC